MPLDADVIVVGSGAIGTSAALHLAQDGRRVLVLEKETGPGLHQSSRNSGVIHPGYNAKPGSLKAKFCVEGSRRLREYCTERRIPMDPGGILVVARTEDERKVLAELHRRAGINGAQTRLVDAATIRELEPHASGIEALHAPEGASFDAQGYVNALAADARKDGAEFRFGTTVRDIHDTATGAEVKTGDGTLTAKCVVNCAGLFADRLAEDLARDLRVIPFRGYYAELTERRRSLVRSHIYAAPDLTFPFLGIHLSKRTDGRVIVGPGAMLAFGREAYAFHQVNVRDLTSTLAWPGFYRLFKGAAFRALIGSEVMKSLSVAAIAREARALLPGLARADLVRSYAGNRAQLVGRDGSLVDDIVVRNTEHSIHVLNAVSPGLTCSLPFGRHLADRIASRAL